MASAQTLQLYSAKTTTTTTTYTTTTTNTIEEAAKYNSGTLKQLSTESPTVSKGRGTGIVAFSRKQFTEKSLSSLLSAKSLSLSSPALSSSPSTPASAAAFENDNTSTSNSKGIFTQNKLDAKQTQVQLVQAATSTLPTTTTPITKGTATSALCERARQQVGVAKEIQKAEEAEKAIQWGRRAKAKAITTAPWDSISQCTPTKWTPQGIAQQNQQQQPNQKEVHLREQQLQMGEPADDANVSDNQQQQKQSTHQNKTIHDAATAIAGGDTEFDIYNNEATSCSNSNNSAMGQKATMPLSCCQSNQYEIQQDAADYRTNYKKRNLADEDVVSAYPQSYASICGCCCCCATKKLHTEYVDEIIDANKTMDTHAIHSIGWRCPKQNIKFHMASSSPALLLLSTSNTTSTAARNAGMEPKNANNKIQSRLSSKNAAATVATTTGPRAASLALANANNTNYCNNSSLTHNAPHNATEQEAATSAVAYSTNTISDKQRNQIYDAPLDESHVTNLACYKQHSINTKSHSCQTSSSSANVKSKRITGHALDALECVYERSSTIFIDLQKVARTFLSLVIIFNMLPLFYAECDQTFVSRIGGPQNGTFSAPLLHNHKNHSRQCLYTFLAGPGQRVEVIFTTFNLRGSPPDGSAVGELPSCVHEYMDIYSEVQSSDPAELINSPFGGRYCGAIPPRRRVSMYRAIAISFFTNKNVTTPSLFEGTYRFLNASEYEIGIPIAGSPCSYAITPSMSINKTGTLISPTYPGAYPKDMSCTYQFLGESNQRVRLEFRDFDLFFGGPHCPFDFVKVYDGPDNSSALISTYCGQQRNLVLYSSESSLFVHFYTLPRTANTQNRGFKGIYEFSESFVKLDFIRENDGIHMRGSECDQKILSRKESTGFVLSPNYPYPYIPKTVCRYFIYGMQDAQHLERVRLEFSAFNIPRVEHKDKESNCTDGYLKIYLKGQETADAYDKFDYELCGNETQGVVSDGPRLAMVFSSGELQGRGFKGKYTFETEYKIPGTAAPDGTCSFTYVSSSKKRGDLNSPRYPSNYPSETNCSYLFLAESNEQVTIVFDHFKVKADGNANATAGAYGSGACFEDWLEMYVVYRDNNDRFLGRYCGLTAPGPVESPRGAVGLRITLHTDQEKVASGFKARYFFETAKSDAGDCGGNFSNEDSGIITSPNYPLQYKAPGKGMASNACNWIMTARPGYKLSINFEHFAVEGDPANRGCPAAVLRLWVNVDSDQPPLELCGEKPAIEQWHYISTGQTARISFTTSDKTIGAQGFRIVWTEIQDSGPGPPSIGLLCESTYHFQCEVGYCISDKLRCDGVKNCGPGDDSDELHCESYHGSARGGSRRSHYNSTSRRLVPNLSPMHTLSLQKKT